MFFSFFRERRLLFHARPDKKATDTGEPNEWQIDLSGTVEAVWHDPLLNLPGLKGYTDEYRKKILEKLPEHRTQKKPRPRVRDLIDLHSILKDLDAGKMLALTEVPHLGLSREDILNAQAKQTLTIPPEKGPAIRGIHALHAPDAEEALKVERLAFADNKNLIWGYPEHAILAADINEALHGKPHLSVKYVDDTGKMRGYSLVYEGILEEHKPVPENFEGIGKPVIYLADIATDKKGSRAGGSMLKAVLQKYEQAYLGKENTENLVPLYTEARESTFLPLFERLLDDIEDKGKFIFERTTLLTYQAGQDTMYAMYVVPTRRNTL